MVVDTCRARERRWAFDYRFEHYEHMSTSVLRVKVCMSCVCTCLEQRGAPVNREEQEPVRAGPSEDKEVEWTSEFR